MSIKDHRRHDVPMLRRIASIIAVAFLLTACGQPNKAADYQEPDTPAQVVTTTSPVPAPTRAAATSPAPTKAPTSKATAKPKPKATTTEPEDVYYANCAAVRAAGAAPIHAGDPGYSRKLDRDGDGVACES
jgi:hypothetical protein